VSDRFSEWLSCHEEHLGIWSTRERYLFACTREVDHVAMCELSISDHDTPRCDEEECRISWRKIRYKFPTSREPDIIELYRRKGLRYSSYRVVLSCYDSDFSSCKINLRDTLSCECLISRLSHLVQTRQIDPELHCMLDPTSTRELLGHELVVHESTPCCHPLDLICADHSATTSGILMFNFSRVDYRHRLESSMWMKPHSRTISINLRRYTPWSIVVKHDKRTRETLFHSLPITWEIVPNTETITHHVYVSGMFDMSDSFLHIDFLLFYLCDE
jgi:hypothetical protein